MKKRNLLILLISLFVLVASFSIYAAFTMTNSYDAEQDFHKIDEQLVTADNASAKIAFKAPGEKITIGYTLAAPKSKNYKYDFSLSLENDNYSDLLNMVYVYQNDIYAGLLSELVDYTKDGVVHIKKNLPLEQYILMTDTNGKKTSFTFELHNASSSFTKSPINLTISCNIKTLDAQKEIVLSSSENIKKVFDDANHNLRTSSGYKIIVLGYDAVISTPFIINNTTAIDLNSHTLTLDNTITVQDGENEDKSTRATKFKIFDSTKKGSVVNANNINLNGANSVVIPEVDLTGMVVTSHNSAMLKEELDLYLNNIYELNGGQVTPLGFFNCYLNKGINLKINGLASANGIYDTTALALNNNHVISIEATLASGISLKEIRIIIKSNKFDELKQNELKHLAQYIIPEGAQNPTYKDVRFNLYLPTVIKKYNATISWSSSDTNVIDNFGRLTKNQGLVVLTATIKINDEIQTQVYYLNAVQQDNATKLQYLVSKINIGKSFTSRYTSNLDPTAGDGSSVFELPIASTNTTLSNHYMKLCNIDEDLGIQSISYQLESTYDYLGLYQTLDNTNNATKAFIALKKLTYEKEARLKIIAKFDGDAEPLSAYIKLEIKLEINDNIKAEIQKDIQAYLNEENVLQNMLDTRQANGLKNMKGDFVLKDKIDAMELRYKNPDKTNALYEIVNGYDLKFTNYSKFLLTESSVAIDAYIVQDNAESLVGQVYFKIPAAITNENFPPFNNIANSRIYNTLVYQTLLQVDPNMIYENQTLLSSLDLAAIKSLPPFILMVDTLRVDKLVFEYNKNELLIDSSAFEVLNNIIAWATNKTNAGKQFNQLEYVNEDLSWITSDGKEELSDGEIAFIVDYCERFPSIAAEWNNRINVGDNELSPVDINTLRLKISEPYFSKILEWIQSTGDSKALYDYFAFPGLNNADSILELKKFYSNGNGLDNKYRTDAIATNIKKCKKTVKGYIFNKLKQSYPIGGEAVKAFILKELMIEINNNTAEQNLTDPEKQKLINDRYNEMFAPNATPEQVNKRNTLYNKFIDSKVLEETKGWSDQKYKDYYVAYNVNFECDSKMSEVRFYHFTVNKDKYFVTDPDTQNKVQIDFPSEILNIYNDSSIEVSNNEERAIVYYVQKHKSTQVYNNFYSAWKSSVKRSDDSLTNNNNLVSIVEGTNIFLTLNYNIRNYTRTIINDPVFVRIFQWIDSTNIKTLESELLEYKTLVDSSDLTTKSEVAGKYVKENTTTQNEYNVLKRYLQKNYDCTNLKTVFSEIERGYREQKSNGYISKDRVLGQDRYYFAEAALNEFVNLVNGGINEQKITEIKPIIKKYVLDFNKVIEWAKLTTLIDKTPKFLTEIQLNYPLGLDSSLYSDGKDTISYDEFIALKNSYNNLMGKIYEGSINTDKAKAAYTRFYWSGFDFNSDISDILNMTCTNVISPKDETAIMNTIQKTTEFDDAIKKITGTNEGDGDRLKTISLDELKTLVTPYANNPAFILEINKRLGSYLVDVSNGISIVYNPDAQIDRKLNEPNEKTFEAVIENSNTLIHKYLTVGQINDNMIENFTLLKYYSALNYLSFRGNKSTDIFTSVKSSNIVFSIITKSNLELTTLVYKYAKLSDIRGIENLVDLTSLDIEGNESKAAGIKYLNDLSPLISLISKKGSNSTFEYLNINHIDTNDIESELIMMRFKKQFGTKIYYGKNGKEVLYDETVTEEKFQATLLASKLHEISVITGAYMLLPTKVEDNGKIGSINWSVVDGQSFAVIRVIKDGLPLKLMALNKGNIVLCASVKYSNVTVTRFFYITIV